MDDNEPFSNPIAPAHEPKSGPTEAAAVQKDQQPLSNDDFRKLMMTPRPGASSSMAAPQSVRGGASASVRGHRKPVLTQEQNENKSKKKKLFQAMKKQEEEQLAELAARYRDRASERRTGANPDYQSEDPLASIPAYRTVAPDVKSVADAAERRKQMIEESKFLGGDMSHTHLVKGLDYALLQKVKAEIQTKDGEEDPDENDEQEDEEAGLPELPDQEDQEVWEVKSVMAKNIINLIERKLPQRNELFLPSRMAYVVDLEDECADDIPTTVIRSRTDCPNWDSLTTLSTNDIVINKLTQILSYLRQGGGAKKKKKEKIPFIDESQKNRRSVVKGGEAEAEADLDGGIYGEDVGDYKPNFETKKDKGKERDMRDRERRAERGGGERRGGHLHSHSHSHSHSYFEKPSLVEKEAASTAGSMRVKPPETKTDRQSFSRSVAAASAEEVAKVRGKLSTLDVPDSYAECYPGAPENDDAIMDSDDEVDYTKMDMGNKKGTVNRWDFESAEAYGEYMSGLEKNPKAAFQYGLKMADGRKTKGKPDSKKDSKAKEERDYQKVCAILTKRKTAEAAEPGQRKKRFQTPATRQPDTALDTQHKRQKH